MSAKRDLVGIGSMVVDRIQRVARIPGADAKALLRSDPAAGVFVGGVMLNQLGWAATLGLETGLFGLQADDADGRRLRGAMDRLGIARDIGLGGSASSSAQIYVDDAGARVIYMAPGATAEVTAAGVREHHAAFIQNARRVSTEISQLPLAAVLEVQAIARKAGVPTVLDVDVPPEDAVPALGDAASLEKALAGADLLKPAKQAARALLGDGPDDALALAVALRARYGNPAVVVTDGAAGCAVAAEGVELRVPAPQAKQVMDTTGAGDAFLGGLLTGLERGLGWEDAARLGNACGAACVEKTGAFPDDPAAVRARVRELYDGPAIPWPEGGAAAASPAEVALDAFEEIVAELGRLLARSRGEDYTAAVALLREVREAGGRIHVTGIGKPEHVARYAASLLASTGNPAAFLHGTETVHGSVGQVVPGDAVIAISNSGETVELRAAVEALRGFGARIVAVTGAKESWLGRNAEVVLDAGVAREGGPLGFAPRASVAAALVALAALSAALEADVGLTKAEYAARHPGGALGEKARS